MRITILTGMEVKESVLKQCSDIVGSKITQNQPDGAEVQIVTNHFVPTPNLRLVQTLSAGVDHFDFSILPKGVTVCSNAGAYSDPVAEHAFALLLANEKKICKFVRKAQNGVFERETVGTLSGATLGIFGFGGIGRSAARIAKAYRMRVVGYSRHPVEDPNLDEFASSVEELFSKSDIVLISIPLSNLTRGIVSRDLLKKFHGNVIINVARAGVVNEQDMLEYLRNNSDFYYLTDVWWNEPNVSFPIPENAILTPHVAGNVDESISSWRFIYACKNIKKFIDGYPENVVDVSEYAKK
ncbi:MAG: 2-hydroxyacid dehydrogenase [Thermoplasmatales archaeon]|nr:2-hydroxyacid dehydrogenase [Thermoplasmatales archaeon]MCW6169634.1 2-hydroxyacid dehydrogenase [Thermoplasmatales archaeon]